MDCKVMTCLLGLVIPSCLLCSEIPTSCEVARTGTVSCQVQNSCTEMIVQDDTHEHEIQQMAITTLASMASSLINIGVDSHNPQTIGTNIINILSSFINFVTFAMRHPQITELLEDELFQEILQKAIIKGLTDKQLDSLDNEIL